MLLKLKILVLFILFIQPIILSGQEILPTVINESLELTSQNSPYLIQENTEIASGGELLVDKGVTILISANKTITNNGRFVINGSKSEPVVFNCSDETLKWKYIYNNNTLIVDDLVIKNAVRLVSSYGDTLILKDCNVTNTFGGIGDDLVGAHYAKKIVIKGCYFEGNPAAGKTDAIDLDGISNDSIINNVLTGFSDDGIDIGTNSKDVVIANNIISNCNMGVSVGETSTVILKSNLLINNYSGIQSHSGSVIDADRNTVYGNKEGLRAFHDNGQATSGGTINIKNSIISNCTNLLSTQVANSSLTINYCLSDSLINIGSGNIHGDALFFDVANNDFSLTASSLAINAGDPDNDGDGVDYNSDLDDQDPDGTRLDLGYIPYFNSSLLINEIISSNLSLVSDEFNQYSDFIELLNNSNDIINLKNFYVSDDKNNLLKHKIIQDLFIPANGMVLLWADGLENDTVNHLPFKLSGNGEYFSISDASGKLIDGVSFPMIPVNKSFGRRLENNQLVYFEQPTPLQANLGDGKIGISAAPVFDKDGGEFTFPQNIIINKPSSNSSIYYSVDGADPSLGNLYSTEIVLNETTTVRAVSVEPDMLTCFPESRIYYPTGEVHLPVLSLSTNEENLYSEKGIYTNYRNSGSLWERPVSIGYCNNTLKFENTAGIRIQGGNSVHMAKKSFRLFFRGGYGSSKLYASPFTSGPNSFENLVLRGGYDDDITTSTGTLLRDPLSAEFWGKLGELATNSDWVSLYLNNKYWGIYNVRESINEYFVEDNMGINEFDLVRFQKWGNTLKYGSLDTWNQLESFFNTTDFTRPEAYDETAAFMDMNSLINLFSFVHCSQFRSWTWGAFGIKPVNGKWTWTIWDTDRAYTVSTWNGFTEYANTSAEKWPNFIPQELIKNEQFKNELINRVCDLLNTTFKPENSLALFDSLKAVIEPEMDNEFNKWNSSGRTKWNTNTENMRTFLKIRPSIVHEQMLDYFSISDSIKITIKIIGKGNVKLNSLTLSETEWEGIYMSNIPIELEAIPHFGSKFIRWENISSDRKISLASSTDKTLVAIFDTVSSQDYMPLVINEIMYHPELNSGGEWVEIFNPNSYAIPLDGYEFTDGGADNSFLFPTESIISAEGYLIVAEDVSTFSSYFSQVSNTIGNFGSGSTGFSLSNNGEKLLLYNNIGELDDSVYYADSYPWPDKADGQGPSLQLYDYKMNNELAASWFASLMKLYSPGEINPTSIKSLQQSESDIQVYPNPFSDNINIQFVNGIYESIDLYIYDLSGRVLNSSTIKTADMNSTIVYNPEIIQKGVYLLRVNVLGRNYNKWYTFKIIRN